MFLEFTYKLQLFGKNKKNKKTLIDKEIEDKLEENTNIDIEKEEINEKSRQIHKDKLDTKNLKEEINIPK